LTLLAVAGCAQPEDNRPEITQLQIQESLDSRGVATLTWQSDEEAMAVVDYGVDSSDVSFSLYYAVEKYRKDHHFQLLQVPDSSFYYRIRHHYPDGSRQSTRYRRFEEPAVNSPDSGLHILVINLGEESGDAIYVKTPGGAELLFDTGTRSGANLVLSVLGSRGVEKIDHFIGTHDHADHIGGFQTLVAGLPVSNFIMPDHSERDYYFSRAAAEVRSSGGGVFEVSRGHSSTTEDFLRWDEDLSVEVWSAGAGDDFPSITYEGSRINNDSPLMKLSYRDFSICLGGDSENEVHQAYVNDISGLDAEVDVYKASHHGRSDSSDRPFLERIDPQTVLISTVDNGSCAGLFQCATLPVFHAVQADVFRTDCASPELNRLSPNTKKNAHIHCFSDGVYYVVKNK